MSPDLGFKHQFSCRLHFCSHSAEGGRGGDPDEERRDPSLAGLPETGQSGEGTAAADPTGPGERESSGSERPGEGAVQEGTAHKLD